MPRRTAELHLASTSSDDFRASVLPRDFDAGERLMRQQGLRGLRAALAGAPAAPANGWLEFWRGYAAQYDDLALARTHWLAAEEVFVRESDACGIELTACGLVQCTLFDSQTYEGFEARALRVAGTAAASGDQSPLELFRVAARLQVGGEGENGRSADAGDIETAFAALGSQLDAEVRLRCAAAALHGIGRSYDRVSAGDFHDAGAAVAALPEVGDYSRALWHVCVSHARWFEAGVVPRLMEELDAVERCASGAAGRRLVARALMLRALHALAGQDATAAREHLEAGHRQLDPAHPRDYAMFHFLFSRNALSLGDIETASAHATMSLHRSEEAFAPASEIGPILNQTGMVGVALGRYEEAAAVFTRAVGLFSGAHAAPSRCYLHLTHALRHLREGSHDEARVELIAGFALARSIEHTHFFRALPRLAAQLCGAALDLDADAAYAGKVVAVRSLECPDRGIARWPWPLRVRAFGGFAIERDGEPFTFGRKAPKRMLDALRLVTALGGRQVDAGRVASTLWPDAEGDEGRDALKAVLHRARALLGADVLEARDGQISFEEDAVWIDTWAFEHVCGRIELLLPAGPGAQHVDDGELERRRLQLFTLYRGHFLGEAESPAWAIAARDRWRERFLRSVVLLGQRAERVGRPEAAITLYRAALEQDNLSEELYQRLIECHLARGENAQALNAFRRCRELLSIVVGLRPSARTEALMTRISGR